MNCPYCQAILYEGCPFCETCGFTLESAASDFEVLPIIRPGITDEERSLNGRERRRLARGIQRFQRRFPQLHFHVVILDLEPEISIAAYNFWLFNNSPLFSALEKGGLNFHLLFLMDPLGRRANLMIGYGLEPFVSSALLDEVVATCGVALNSGNFADAALAVIDSATARLMEICDAIPSTYGLEPPY